MISRKIQLTGGYGGNNGNIKDACVYGGDYSDNCTERGG